MDLDTSQHYCPTETALSSSNYANVFAYLEMATILSEIRLVDETMIMASSHLNGDPCPETSSLPIGSFGFTVLSGAANSSLHIRIPSSTASILPDPARSVEPPESSV